MPAKCAALAASCVLLVAATAGGIQGQEQPLRRGTAAGQRQYLTPLDRLKARSPEQRWENLSGAAHDPALNDSTERPSAAEAGIGEDAGIGRLKPDGRRPVPDADRFLPAGHDRPFPDDTQSDVHDAEATDLQMPREFPGVERFDVGDAMPAPAGVESEDAIYQEIEDEFPRIRIETTEAPPAEPLTPVEQPAIEPTYSTYAEPVRVAQVPNFDDSPESQSMGELVSSPKDLKPLTGIQPYFDYEPDRELQETDPYRNVFPRPDEIVETEQGKQFPEIVDLGQDLYQHRNLAQVDFYWMASDFWHYPLYFQDVQFERYGHTYNELIQPFVSFGRFGTQFFGLPYQMSLHPICQKQYTLGWYRPGECAPYLHYQIPLNADAAVRTGAFYTGMIFAFP